MCMPRMRYWKLTIEEVKKLSYNESKVLNWEIKCTREPEEEAKFVGVFLYKNGTPKDYETVKGSFLSVKKIRSAKMLKFKIIEKSKALAEKKN